MTAKNTISSLKAASLAAGVMLALIAVLTISAGRADAQVAPTTCPSATVFYVNGYSNNYCVPSYYPGYPQITVNSGYYYGNAGSYNNGYYYGNAGSYNNGYYYGNGYGNTGNSGAFNPYENGQIYQPYQGNTVSYNPFTPQYNNPFYPYQTVPTYYYPPAPAPAPYYHHGW